MMNRFFTLLFAASCLTAVGQSLSFDGVDDWVEVPSINLTGSPFNIEGWIQVPPVTFTDQTNIIDNYVFGSGGSDRWGVYVGGAEESGGQFAGQLYAPTFDIQPSENGLRIDDNEWHHFAVQRNELGESFLYIDGLLVNSGSCALDYNLDAGFPTRINGGYHCGGVTPQCRFMTCVLANIQVSLSVKYVSAFSADCQILTAPDAVLHFVFDDASSGYVADLSGSENDGIIYGAIFSEEEPECICSDAMACNYNESESCHYDCYFCLEGTIWSEELGGCIVANPADINFDGCVQLNDLLDLLSAYGNCGAEESPWQCGDPLEYQGYDYETVQIGEQCWFAENLRNENYENSDAIPAGLSDSEWENTSFGAVAVFEESSSNLENYGRLYNWYSVDDEDGLCPSGWHVPSDGEWMTMEMALGMSEAEANDSGFRGTDQGNQMKTSYGWCCGGGSNGTNTSGFSGLPGGLRVINGLFTNSGSDGKWWSSSPNGSGAWSRTLTTFGPVSELVNRDSYGQSYGLSVRCIKDTDQ